jgi:hypothetical protein
VTNLIFSLVIGLGITLNILFNFCPVVNAVVNQDRYWSVLTGDQMIPPVKTNAVGYIGLKYPDDMSKIIFTVNAKNIGNVTGIYFYLANASLNDTLILDLLKAERKHKADDIKIINITSGGKISGTLSVGGATKKDLEGSLNSKSIADLHELMVQGKIYISVHTKDFPNGEIRGNYFVGMQRLFPDDADIKWK